ncbi:MAG: anti-sigma regulatory factor [Candidatus Omnitrophica bacterium]|nr:anti-sigma regulatory factor [Candidatus Omnitrophota bacterium]
MEDRKPARLRELNIAVKDDNDLVYIRQRAKGYANKCLFDSVNQTRIVTAVSEIIRNVVVFAESGKIKLKQIPGGIEITVTDKGPGIKDIQLALKDGFSTARSLGIGLPGARRLMDYFDIKSRPGKGTRVVMRKFR